MPSYPIVNPTKLPRRKKKKSRRRNKAKSTRKKRNPMLSMVTNPKRRHRKPNGGAMKRRKRRKKNALKDAVRKSSARRRRRNPSRTRKSRRRRRNPGAFPPVTTRYYRRRRRNPSGGGQDLLMSILFGVGGFVGAKLAGNLVQKGVNMVMPAEGEPGIVHKSAKVLGSGGAAVLAYFFGDKVAKSPSQKTALLVGAALGTLSNATEFIPEPIKGFLSDAGILEPEISDEEAAVIAGMITDGSGDGLEGNVEVGGNVEFGYAGDEDEMGDSFSVG